MDLSLKPLTLNAFLACKHTGIYGIRFQYMQLRLQNLGAGTPRFLRIIQFIFASNGGSLLIPSTLTPPPGLLEVLFVLLVGHHVHKDDGFSKSFSVSQSLQLSRCCLPQACSECSPVGDRKTCNSNGVCQGNRQSPLPSLPDI